MHLNSNTQTQSVPTDIREVKEDLWEMTVQGNYKLTNEQTGGQNSNQTSKEFKHKKSLDITPTLKMSTVSGENGDFLYADMQREEIIGQTLMKRDCNSSLFDINLTHFGRGDGSILREICY